MKRYLSAILIFTILLPLNLKAAEITPTDQEMKERIIYIQKVLDEGEGAGQTWWSCFTLIAAAQAAINLGAVVSPEDQNHPTKDKNRPSNIVGGTVAAMGVFNGLILVPFPAALAPYDLRETPDDDLKAKLAKAESLLKASAKAEIYGKSWTNHAVIIGTQAIAALTIYTFFNDYIKERDGDPTTAALTSFIMGASFSELQIWLQPTRAIEDWNNYEKKYITGRTPSGLVRQDSSYHVFAAPVISTNMAGIVAGVSF